MDIVAVAREGLEFVSAHGIQHMAGAGFTGRIYLCVAMPDPPTYMTVAGDITTAGNGTVVSDTDWSGPVLEGTTNSWLYSTASLTIENTEPQTETIVGLAFVLESAGPDTLCVVTRFEFPVDLPPQGVIIRSIGILFGECP